MYTFPLFTATISNSNKYIPATCFVEHFFERTLKLTDSSAKINF